MGRKLAIACIALAATYTAGGMSMRHSVFPWPQLLALRETFGRTQIAAKSRYSFDSHGRLIADETKTAVTCPTQTDRTAVLLVLGQSNAANHAGQRYASEYNKNVINIFDGRCFIAVSPLLGSTDAFGEYWTQLGNLMISSGKIDKVVIAPLAISGSSIERWAEGGDLNELLDATVEKIRRANYKVTGVLWHQGESDYVIGTSAQSYQRRFLSMVGTLRKHGVEAPVYISIASKCLEPSNGGFKTHDPDNAISTAQVTLSAQGTGLKLGVNTDALLGDLDRFDDCHIAGSGAIKVSKAWAEILLSDETVQAKTPGTGKQ